MVNKDNEGHEPQTLGNKITTAAGQIVDFR